MIRLHGFAPRGAGGPYTLQLQAGQVLGLLGGRFGESRRFLEAVAGSGRHGGQVEVAGRLRRARDIAYAPDEPEQILFGRTGRDALGDGAREEVLRAMGGGHLLDRDFLQLSTGERRRLALAAVLGSGRSLLLFDQPTAGLDPEGQEQFWAALRASGTAAIVAALDEAEAQRCDLLLAVPSEGAPILGGGLLLPSLASRAGWPTAPLAQLAFALCGAERCNEDNLREEVEARCAAPRRR